MVRYCKVCLLDGNRVENPTIEHVNEHLLEEYGPDYSNIDCDCLCHDSMYVIGRGSMHCWICDPDLSQAKKEAIRKDYETCDIEYKMTNDIPLTPANQEYLDKRRAKKPDSMGRVRVANNLIHPTDHNLEEQ